MSEEDFELERLKAKRLAEMQKNISSREEIKESVESPKEKITVNPRASLVNILGFRGLEVLKNAESQFPNETKIIVEKLFELIKTGEINETIDGGKLLMLFRSVGLNVRMETKINVEQDGKFVSLSDKLSKNSSENSDEE
ncbi:DNA-binding protein [Nitrosopumilus ureiphilus]|uniref:Double-stranded DNA-binding protein n=1 Tax=Nitrosopumilus ureiphilus TaxID=1470067 RepID=A0A7D5M6A4_9ARCH|nr:DNA-binding protein [Nitrosopumilus ureiphilus]QLH07513.1 double-stranded DNA-binding protein [Nitrosopumilus ureiphilus]